MCIEPVVSAKANDGSFTIRNFTDYKQSYNPDDDTMTLTLLLDVEPTITKPRKIYIRDSRLINKSMLLGATIRKYEIKDSDGEEILSGYAIPWSGLMRDIWKTMKTPEVLGNTSFNIKTTKTSEKGFIWNNHMSFSYQGKDSHGTFREIVSMVKYKNFRMKLKIKLSDDSVIYLKI